MPGGFLAERAPDVAFYSEDRGWLEPPARSRRSATPLLVVDPIDGTRPAMAGLESCCVSVAAAPLGRRQPPTMGDVDRGLRGRDQDGDRVPRRARTGLEIRDGDGDCERRT